MMLQFVELPLNIIDNIMRLIIENNGKILENKIINKNTIIKKVKTYLC